MAAEKEARNGSPFWVYFFASVYPPKRGHCRTDTDPEKPAADGKTFFPTVGKNAYHDFPRFFPSDTPRAKKWGKITATISGKTASFSPSGENFPHILRLFQPNVGKNRKPDIAVETPQNSRPTDAKTKKHPRKEKGHKGRSGIAGAAVRCGLLGHIKKIEVRNQISEFQGVACGDASKYF